MENRDKSEFLTEATNVYRTREYIVKQKITLHEGDAGRYLMSNDTYYRCTPQRDREYETVFSERNNINGKRISTAVYMRKYID